MLKWFVWGLWAEQGLCYSLWRAAGFELELATTSSSQLTCCQCPAVISDGSNIHLHLKLKPRRVNHEVETFCFCWSNHRPTSSQMLAKESQKPPLKRGDEICGDQADCPWGSVLRRDWSGRGPFKDLPSSPFKEALGALVVWSVGLNYSW